MPVIPISAQIDSLFDHYVVEDYYSYSFSTNLPDGKGRYLIAAPLKENRLYY